MTAKMHTGIEIDAADVFVHDYQTGEILRGVTVRDLDRVLTSGWDDETGAFGDASGRTVYLEGGLPYDEDGCGGAYNRDDLEALRDDLR
jgi:hypothetical protein